MSDPGLLIEQRPDTLRIVITPGRRERASLAVAATSILIFGLLMSGGAAISLKHTGVAGRYWWLPFIFSGLMLPLFALGLTVIGAIPTTVVVLNQTELSIGDDFNERRTVLPRTALRSISVSRLPMVPIGTMVIRSAGNAPARAGYWRNKELIAAANQLRTAAGLRK